MDYRVTLVLVALSVCYIGMLAAMLLTGLRNRGLLTNELNFMLQASAQDVTLLIFLFTYNGLAATVWKCLAEDTNREIYKPPAHHELVNGT